VYVPLLTSVSTVHQWRAPAEAEGERLDRYLAEHYDLPRSRIQGWLREGRVTVDGEVAKPSLRVAGGSEIACSPLEIQQPVELVPRAGALTVLHEDEHLVAIDKQAGIVVHPGAGRESDTLVHRLLARFPEIARVGGAGRPGIVHRLDRDTTGVLLVARTDRAYRALSEAFAERRVEKTYLALAYGEPSPTKGLFDAPIGRHPQRRKEMAVVANGRPARTRYACIRAGSGICLLELGLETGRTHQIRVPLKAAGHPLVGDPVYGEARYKGLQAPARHTLAAFPRPALHAWRLVCRHPASGATLDLEAAPPNDLLELWTSVTRSEWPHPTAGAATPPRTA
jgi:23S rRNA pseudouridine1911/1915/1917 synthase